MFCSETAPSFFWLSVRDSSTPRKGLGFVVVALNRRFPLFPLAAGGAEQPDPPGRRALPRGAHVSPAAPSAGETLEREKCVQKRSGEEAPTNGAVLSRNGPNHLGSLCEWARTRFAIASGPFSWPGAAHLERFGAFRGVSERFGAFLGVSERFCVLGCRRWTWTSPSGTAGRSKPRGACTAVDPTSTSHVASSPP